jgi:hypothetical protein
MLLKGVHWDRFQDKLYGTLIALSSIAPNLNIVVFAHDNMIMINGPSLPDIFTTLQNTLQIIED